MTLQNQPVLEPYPRPCSKTWTVYYEGGFTPVDEREKAGEEVPLRQEFTWGGEHYLVPSVYLCSKGLLLELCRRVKPELLRMDEGREPWQHSPRDSQIDALALEVNGRSLRLERGYGAFYEPLSKEEDPCALQAVEHYGLEARYAWGLERYCFSWDASHCPRLKSLILDLRSRKSRLPGPEFQVKGPGQELHFLHPFTGLEQRLKVEALERVEFSKEQESLWTLLYGLDSELPEDAFSLKGHGEHLHRALPKTAGNEGLHLAYSSSEASPEEIRWQLEFYQQTLRDLTVTLLEPDLRKK